MRKLISWGQKKKWYCGLRRRRPTAHMMLSIYHLLSGGEVLQLDWRILLTGTAALRVRKGTDIQRRTVGGRCCFGARARHDSPAEQAVLEGHALPHGVPDVRDAASGALEAASRDAGVRRVSQPPGHVSQPPGHVGAVAVEAERHAEGDEGGEGITIA